MKITVQVGVPDAENCEDCGKYEFDDWNVEYCCRQFDSVTIKDDKPCPACMEARKKEKQ